MNWVHVSLIRKRKAGAQAKQKEKLIHYFPSPGRCPATFWETEAQYAPWLLGRTSAITTNVLPSSSFPWGSIAEHDVILCGTSLWSVWITCLSYVLPQPFLHVQSTDVAKREVCGERAVIPCQPCSIAAKTLLFSHSFSHSCGAQHHICCGERG